MSLEFLNPMAGDAGETLGHLLETRNPDAVQVMWRMGQIRRHAVPVHSAFGEMHVRARQLSLETSFFGLNDYATQSDCETVVEFPCGFLPRPSFRQRTYVGLGTEETTKTAAGVLKILDPEGAKNASFFTVDPTNPSYLLEAFDHVRGKTVVLTSGLLMYLTNSELELLCQVMGQVLSTCDAEWVTSDPESACQFMDLLKALSGERYMDVLLESNDMRQWKTAGQFDNAMVIDPRWDFDRLCLKSMAFLTRNGLTAERIPAKDYVHGAAVNPAMLHHAFWKIQATREAKERLTGVTAPGLEMTAALQGDTLMIRLSGRLDALSSSEFIRYYERISGPIRAVEINCADLQFISSAGLRAFMIILKKHPVTLTDVRDAVSEILGMTGLDTLVSIRNHRS